MCFGGGGGDPGAAARAEEAARQQRITEGTQMVNAIFEGGRVASSRASGYKPGQRYYTSNGEEWTPRPDAYYTTTQDAGKDRPPQKVLPSGWELRAFGDAGPLYTSISDTKGFTPDFYSERGQAYRDYAMPQLQDQYQRAYEQLVYGLSRRGLLRSSEGAKQIGLLNRNLDAGRRRIADEAMGQENTLRSAVESNRQNLLSQLTSTGNADLAVQSALANAQSLRQPTSFGPLGDMFGDVTGLLAANQRARAYDSGVAPLIPGLKLFNSAGSSRVIS